MIRNILFILLIFVVNSYCFCQHSFKQFLDSTEILIGDQLYLTQRSSSIPKDPDPINQLSQLGWLEILDPGKWILSPDQYFERKIKFSVYDTGYFTIPILNIKLDSQNLQTTPLSLIVFLPIDSTNSLYPIKDIIRTETSDYTLIYVLCGMVVLLLILVLLYFLFKADKIKPKSLVYVKKELAFETALRKLQELEGQKLWQSNQVKEYYDNLHHILRSYLYEGFKIPALESSTTEIADQMNESHINWNKLDEFFLCLNFSDLVKFANRNAEISDHMNWMNFAKSFVIHNKENSLEFLQENKNDFKSLLGTELGQQFENPEEIVPENLLSLYDAKGLGELVLISSLSKISRFKIPAQWSHLHKSKLGQLSSWHTNLLSQYSGMKGIILLMALLPLIAVFLPVLFLVGLSKKENIFARGIFLLSKNNKLLIDHNKINQ